MRRFDTECKAGVVDQYIDFLPFGRQGVEGCLDGCAFGDIHYDRQQSRSDLGCQCIQPVLATCGGDNAMSVSDKFTSDAGAKPRRSAGDEYDHENFSIVEDQKDGQLPSWYGYEWQLLLRALTCF